MLKHWKAIVFVVLSVLYLSLMYLAAPPAKAPAAGNVELLNE